MLRGDLPRLHRCTSIITESSSSPIARSKPLKYAYEKEIVLYALHKKLDYFSTECIYSPEAFRGSARSLVKSLEKVRPSAILDIVRSGEAFSRMVPERTRGTSCLGEQAPGNGGCSRGGGGRASGGEMATMEKLLVLGLEDSLEVGVMASPVKPKVKQTPRKTREQKMSNCKECGYLTSQELCKACTLLHGLNKNRPRTMVELEVQMEDEGASPRLRQNMEALRLISEG